MLARLQPKMTLQDFLEGVWNDANKPERVLIWYMLYYTLVDAYNLANGNAAHFQDSGTMSKSVDRGRKLVILEEAATDLRDWLDSERFEWYMRAVGFNPRLARNFLIQVSSGWHQKRACGFIQAFGRFMSWQARRAKQDGS